jgi:DHA1 family bicyclomycin/chloramphenicol resistance-like MFS transporter
MVTSVGPERLLTIGVATIIVAGAGLMVTVLAGGGLAPVEICFFLILSSFGMVAPNATALALAPYPHVAGSASALMGLTQFCLGAAVAPLVGIAGSRSAVPTASVIATLAVVGGIVLALSMRRIAGPTVAPVVY